jgi:glycosyltransferase involved in cell wall biosynthesis
MSQPIKVQFYPFIDNIHTVHNSIVNHPPKGYEFIGNKSGNFFKIVKKSNKSKILRFLYHQFLKVFNTTRIIDSSQKSNILDEAEIVFSGTPSVKTNKPLILYMLDHPTCLAGNNYNLFIKNKERIERELRENCQSIIITNETPIKFMQQNFPKDIVQKIELIRPAIEDQGYKAKKNKKKTVLFMGSINIPQDFYVKGGLDVIRVFKKISNLNNVDLIIRCHVPEEIKKEIKKIKNVSLIDEKIPFKDLIAIYQKTDILLLPGHNYSVTTTIEGMSFGIPIVALNTYAVEDFVKDGYTGVIVERSSKIKGYDNPAYPTWIRSNEFMKEILETEDTALVDRLTKAVKDLLKDEKRLNTLSKNSRKEFLEKYSIEVRNKSLKRVFDRVINEKRKQL